MDAVASARCRPRGRKRSQRTAKSCGPGAATLASSWREVSRWRRWQERPLTGESTKQTVRPLRGESRDVSAVPVVLPPCISLHGDYGRSRRPAFPAPSLQGEGQCDCKARTNRVARTKVHVPCCGLKHDVVPAQAGTHDPRPNLIWPLVVGPPSTMPAGGYGPRPSPGRHPLGAPPPPPPPVRRPLNPLPAATFPDRNSSLVTSH